MFKSKSIILAFLVFICINLFSCGSKIRLKNDMPSELFEIKELQKQIIIEYSDNIKKEVDSSKFHKVILYGFNKNVSEIKNHGLNLKVIYKSAEIIFTNYKSSIIEEIEFEGHKKDYFDLDYGIYWYGKNGKNEKHIYNKKNKYYDENKPTIIYTHGWQPGRVTSKTREKFNWSDLDGPDINVADYWIQKGWNIGIFYWYMFSDEEEVNDAEAKIWTSKGPVKMRWLNNKGIYTEKGVKRSASRLFFDAYVSAMKDYKGDNIRIAGHSLGNQMATLLTAQIYSAYSNNLIGKNMLPKRLTIMDPFWSKGKKDYLNKYWTGEVARSLVNNFISFGLPVVLYRSSSVTSHPLLGDDNSELIKKVAFVEIRPKYFERKQKFDRKHHAGAWHYFYSMKFPPPKDDSGATAPSPSSSNEDIKAAMGSDFKWVHSGGTETKTPEDDSYKKKKK